ncbi:hypothetical protein QAD02_010664 [Eretmocerus hayati]|uniref:Uncharacterized protein n=1 Tax=Eretmocerus hayati TaxID=131215 RepID=A0ACC2NVH8_9HYME|nr:hypothetical protein QAD02_010664 [Eretmocerus hayati]
MTEALLNVKFCGLLIVVSILLGIFNILLCIFVLYTISDRDRIYKSERKYEIENIQRNIEALEKNHRNENERRAKEAEKVRVEWKKKFDKIEQDIQVIKNETIENLSKLFKDENMKRSKEITEVKNEFDQRMKQESSSVERRILRFELYISKMKEIAVRSRDRTWTSYLDEIKAITLEN